jgi:hypothetical protein
MTTPESRSETKQQLIDDPVLSMLGVGKQLWERESGDRFLERLRSEGLPPLPFEGQPQAPTVSAPESNVGADSG